MVFLGKGGRAANDTKRVGKALVQRGKEGSVVFSADASDNLVKRGGHHRVCQSVTGFPRGEEHRNEPKVGYYKRLDGKTGCKPTWHMPLVRHHGNKTATPGEILPDPALDMAQNVLQESSSR